jgi:RNA polymerase sigma-70 factor, ECF subfamily
MVNWHDRVPPGFLFAVKACRYITHIKKLRDTAEEVERFFGLAIFLGEHLGPTLYQLPPNLHKNLSRLEEFIASIPMRDRAHESRKDTLAGSGAVTYSGSQGLSRRSLDGGVSHKCFYTRALRKEGGSGILRAQSSVSRKRMEKDTQSTEQTGTAAHLNTKVAVERSVPASGENGAVLAGRLRQGEQAAAGEFVDRYYERVYLFMRAIGHDRQISEDLTQETFLRAWYHIGQLRDGKALNGWLFRIAGNVSRLHRRRFKGKDTVSIEGVEPAAAGADGPSKVGQQEQLDQLRQAVTRLPWKLRQAVVLHYMEQLTITEAADAAGIREGTLKSRLNRGLEALRKEVADE